MTNGAITPIQRRRPPVSSSPSDDVNDNSNGGNDEVVNATSTTALTAAIAPARSRYNDICNSSYLTLPTCFAVTGLLFLWLLLIPRLFIFALDNDAPLLLLPMVSSSPLSSSLRTEKLRLPFPGLESTSDSQLHYLEQQNADATTKDVFGGGDEKSLTSGNNTTNRSSSSSGGSSATNVQVFDAFIYNGEPIVALRLQLLSPVVDRFYITEATMTLMGQPKAQLYKNVYADIFEPYQHKITWIILTPDDVKPALQELYAGPTLTRYMPLVGPLINTLGGWTMNYYRSQEPWVREKVIRNYVIDVIRREWWPQQRFRSLERVEMEKQMEMDRRRRAQTTRHQQQQNEPTHNVSPSLLPPPQPATDFILLSCDSDEIPRRDLIHQLRTHRPSFEVIARAERTMGNPSFSGCSFSRIELRMIYFMYNFNWRLDEVWTHSVVLTSRAVLQGNRCSPRSMRSGAVALGSAHEVDLDRLRSRHSAASIPNGGVHCSFCFGRDQIREKLSSFAHFEYNKDELKTDEHIDRGIREGRHLMNRDHVKGLALHRYEQKMDVGESPLEPLIMQFNKYLESIQLSRPKATESSGSK